MQDDSNKEEWVVYTETVPVGDLRGYSVRTCDHSRIIAMRCTLADAMQIVDDHAAVKEYRAFQRGLIADHKQMVGAQEAKDYGSNAGIRCDVDEGPCACGAWH